MVTSHEVARLAGVSQPTVSRALNGSSKVSDATRRRVREAAAALGYVPSATGRALSVGRSYRVGLLLTDLANQFYPYVISAMHEATERLGYQLVLLTEPWSAESVDAATIADRIAAAGLDGVLLTTTTRDSVLPLRLRDRGIPFVYFNRVASAVDADSTTVDASAGMSALAHELRRLGHPEAAAIFGPRNTSTGESREACLREALEAVGIGVPRALVRHGPFDFETGRSYATELLAAEPRPTVIVCGNDVVALGALDAATAMGVRVPEEVSLVGFDDLPMSSWALVQLTTIAFDLDAMARQAAELLITRVAGEVDGAGAFRHLTFPTRLVRRRTLGPSRSH